MFIMLYVMCGKCGNKLAGVKVFKSIRDVINSVQYHCPNCGRTLSASDYEVSVKKE